MKKSKNYFFEYTWRARAHTHTHSLLVVCVCTVYKVKIKRQSCLFQCSPFPNRHQCARAALSLSVRCFFPHFARFTFNSVWLYYLLLFSIFTSLSCSFLFLIVVVGAALDFVAHLCGRCWFVIKSAFLFRFQSGRMSSRSLEILFVLSFSPFGIIGVCSMQ